MRGKYTRPAAFLPFSEFPLELLEKVEHLTTPEEVIEALQEPIDLPEELTATEKAIVMHIFMYLYAFCKEHNFSFAEMSTLLSIVKRTIRTDLRERRPMSESFEEFKALVLQHSVQRPPVSIKVFERTHVPTLMDYILTSYFKQFRLYQLIFSRHQAPPPKQQTEEDEPTTATDADDHSNNANQQSLAVHDSDHKDDPSQSEEQNQQDLQEAVQDENSMLTDTLPELNH